MGIKRKCRSHCRAAVLAQPAGKIEVITVVPYRVHRLLLGLLALSLASGCAMAPMPEPAVWRQTTFGLCEDYPEESRTIENARRDLAVAKATGARVLRIAFGWDAMEMERGVYDWSFWDEYVRSAVDEHGIELIPYVCYTPKWAATDQGEDFWRSPPRDPADFARFMEVIVHRYRDRIHTWELWNEPDNQAYWLGTPQQFAALIRAGSAAVRAADPGARIVLGGIAGEVDFLAKVIVEEKILPHVDVVNIHSYFETWHPSPIEKLPGYIESVFALVRDAGGRHPIWMAETGYSSVGDRAEISGIYRTHFLGEHTDVAQASALARTAFATLSTGQVSLFAWYRINDLVAGQDVIGDDNNRHLGILRVNGAPKPSLSAFAYLAQLFAQPYDLVPVRFEVTQAREAIPQVHAYRLKDGRIVVAAWLGIPDGPAGPKPMPDPREAVLRITVPEVRARNVTFRSAQGLAVGGTGLTWRSRRDGLELTLPLRGSDVVIAEGLRAAR